MNKEPKEPKESFVFFKSFYEALKEIPKENRLEVYEALCEYSLNDNIPNDLEGISKAMFILMKPNIDKANARYKASVENGKKGGRPRKNELQEKPNQNLDKTQNKPNQNLNVDDNVDDNVNYAPKGACSNEETPFEPAPQKTPVITLILKNQEEYPIYQNDVDEYKQLYPDINVMQELRKMKGWCKANPGKRKTKNGIRRFINNWLTEEQNNITQNLDKTQNKPKKSNSFNSFPQNSYDFNKLEEELLEN